MRTRRPCPYNRRLEERLVWGTSLIFRLNLYATYLTLLHVGQVIPSTMADNAAHPPPVSAATDKEEIESYRKIFSSLRMHKQDDFPSLIRQENGNWTKISPSEGLAWATYVENWCAAHGAHGFLALVNKSVALSENGNEKLRLFPDSGPSNDEIANTWQGQRAYLLEICELDFARQIGFPTAAVLAELSEPKIRVLFSGVRNFAAQFSFRLKRAATEEGKFISHFQDIIDSPARLSLNDPFDGFTQFKQITVRFGKEPQGSALQLKEKLLQGLKDKLSDNKLTLWNVTSIMDTTSTQLINIVQKQPSLRTAAEMEAVQAVGDLALRLSRKHMDDSSSSAPVQIGASKINHYLLQNCDKFPDMSWMDFHVFAANLFATYLPAQPAKGGSSSSSAPASSKIGAQIAALLAEANVDLGGGGGFLANWICERCGCKGHRQKNCTAAKPNPEAPRLVQQAKEQRAQKRKEKFGKRAQREHIIKQQKTLASQGPSSASNPPSKDASNDASDQPGSRTPVKASLSVVTSTEAGMPRYVYQCQFAKAENVESCTSPFLLLLLTMTGCMLGALVCAMTTGLGSSPLHAATILVSIALSTAAFMSPATRTSPSGRSLDHYALLWMLVCGPLLCFFATGSNAFVVHNPVALPATPVANMLNDAAKLWVDSGCSKTVIRNTLKLCNLRPPDRPYQIQGIGGNIEVTHMGDLRLTLREENGTTHVRLIRDCLVAPNAPANLLSTKDLQAAGIGFEISSAPDSSASLNLTTAEGNKIPFPLEEHNGLYMVPFCEDIMTVFANVASHQLRALTPGELWHLRLCHAHPSKLAKLSHNCVGMKQPLAEHSHPCHICHEAKATRQDFPKHIDHSDDDDILTMDLVDMGKDNITPAGFKYMTIFVVVRTRFVMVFCHKSRKDLPKVLRKAFARLGRYPRILRSDGAWEYDSAEVDEICLQNNIQQQHSNPHQQFGNALPETMVDYIGRGIRVSLHDANLPPRFWSYAAVNCVDVYNHLPHSALNNKTPWECEKGTVPDVSWFRPFGCRATVFIGDHKEQLWHRKLAARGEPCVYLGLAFSRGMKGWVCWNPENDKVYCTRNVVFDETFMPLRPYDQRVLGHYDSAPRTRLTRAAYEDLEAAANNAAEIDNLPTSRVMDQFEEISDDEAEDIARPPAGRDSHDEADYVIVDLDDQDS